MTTLGYPGKMHGIPSSGYRSIGSVQKRVTGALGYPGKFHGIPTTGWTNIGALQRAPDISGTLSTTLGALTLASSGTFIPPSGGGSQGGSPLEITYRTRPREVTARITAIAHGKTIAMATASPVAVATATAWGHSTANASPQLIAQSSSRSIGYSVSMSARCVLVIAPRNEMRIRDVSSTFAIG